MPGDQAPGTDSHCRSHRHRRCRIVVEPELRTVLTFGGQPPLDQYFGVGELTTGTIRLIHLPRLSAPHLHGPALTAP